MCLCVYVCLCVICVSVCICVSVWSLCVICVSCVYVCLYHGYYDRCMRGSEGSASDASIYGLTSFSVIVFPGLGVHCFDQTGYAATALYMYVIWPGFFIHPED